jgi:hypothetical protein
VYGLIPQLQYALSRWDTYTGRVMQTDVVTTLPDGSIQIPVHDLESDSAFKAYPLTVALW